MRGKRATTEQIIAVLKEAEAGAKPKELCRKHGISDQTLYNWKAKYGGMTVSEARRLKYLEQENGRLKRQRGMGAAAGTQPAAGAPVAAVTPAGTPPVAVAGGGCGGQVGCYDASSFLAQIATVSPSIQGTSARDHLVKMEVQFRNTSGAPSFLRTTIRRERLSTIWAIGTDCSSAGSKAGIAISKTP